MRLKKNSPNHFGEKQFRFAHPSYEFIVIDGNCPMANGLLYFLTIERYRCLTGDSFPVPGQPPLPLLRIIVIPLCPYH